MRWLPLLLLAGCTTQPKPSIIMVGPPKIPQPLFSYIPLVAVPPPKQPYKPLPPLRVPNISGHWWLQTSTDLQHWTTLYDFNFQYLPTEIFYTPPNTGSKFFRFIGHPYPPESFQQRPLPPGLDVNQ